MTAYFYFTLSVIYWNWSWPLLVQGFEPHQRAALFIFLTLTVFIDLFSIYEFLKSKGKIK